MSRFKVLWIDDQKRKCVRDSKAIAEIIRSYGFEPDIVFEDNISQESLIEPEGTLYRAIKARDVDLYVVDYNLKNNVFGSDIIRKIRNDNDVYTDIVFYSSESKELIDAIKASFGASSIMDFCDGVYVAPLGDEFIPKVEYVINKIIKSWFNVHSIRGVILSKASKFEQMVSSIILENYGMGLSSVKARLEEKGKNVVNNVTQRWESVVRTDDPIGMIVHDPINFNWTVKKVILQELIDKNIVCVENWERIVSIFNLRNDFAHNPIHLKDGKLILSKKGKEITFTEDDVEEIRNDLMNIENELRILLSCEGIDEAEERTEQSAG